MIGERYVGFIEATAFDSGYRRACSDLLAFLESIKPLKRVNREGMELLRVLCVPENLEAVATGDADIYRDGTAKDGKARYFVKFREPTETRENVCKASADGAKRRICAEKSPKPIQNV